VELGEGRADMVAVLRAIEARTDTAGGPTADAPKEAGRR
jgi:3-hydroxyisobutyrate dehydrogenase